MTTTSAERSIAAEEVRDGYTVISADTHALVPKKQFRPYVEHRHAQAFEEEVRSADRERAICREGRKAFLDHRPEAPEDERCYTWNRAAEEAEANPVWEPARRLAMTEAEGVVSTVILPAGGASRPPWEGFVQPVSDPELREARKRVDNCWLAHFCSLATERVAGVALMRLSPIDAEVGRSVATIARPLEEPPAAYPDKLVFGRSTGLQPTS